MYFFGILSQKKRLDHESQKSGFRFYLKNPLGVLILWIRDPFLDFRKKTQNPFSDFPQKTHPYLHITEHATVKGGASRITIKHKLQEAS